MSPMYEIVVFEYRTAYDGDYVAHDNALETFITYCRKYINPREIPKERTEFSWGHTYVSYTDHSGNDKPKMIMLMGLITPEMRSEIKTALDDLYFNTCEDCKAKISLEWCVCAACRANPGLKPVIQ